MPKGSAATRICALWLEKQFAMHRCKGMPESSQDRKRLAMDTKAWLHFLVVWLFRFKPAWRQKIPVPVEVCNRLGMQLGGRKVITTHRLMLKRTHLQATRTLPFSTIVTTGMLHDLKKYHSLTDNVWKDSRHRGVTSVASILPTHGQAVLAPRRWPSVLMLQAMLNAWQS